MAEIVVIKEYMLDIYAFEIELGIHTIRDIPKAYQKPVAEYMAKAEEERLKEQ